MSNSDNDFILDLETLIQPNLLSAALVAFKATSRHLYINKYDYSNILTIARGQVFEGMNEVYRQAEKWIKEDELWLTPKIDKTMPLENPLSSACLLKIALEKGIIEFAPEWHTSESFVHFFGDLPQIRDTNRSLENELKISYDRYFSLRNLKIPTQYEDTFARSLIADSRVHVLGTALTGKATLISSNRYFSDWLTKNDPLIVSIEPKKRFSELEKAISHDTKLLNIQKVLNIIEKQRNIRSCDHSSRKTQIKKITKGRYNVLYFKSDIRNCRQTPICGL